MGIVDINCDVGEGMNNEADIFPLISSCNIACGGHAGSEDIMESLVLLAQKEKVRVGAHPSYPDRVNFGRVSISISKEELINSILEQIENLMRILDLNDEPLHHIKAHGALYNDLAWDTNVADYFLEAVSGYKEESYLYLPYGCPAIPLAKSKGFRVRREAFADRAYREDLSLVSRKKKGAVLESPNTVWEHLRPMIFEGKVRTDIGEWKKMEAETFCIHGDGPHVLEILMYIDRQLTDNQTRIQK